MELNKLAKDPHQRDEWRRFTLQNNLLEKNVMFILVSGAMTAHILVVQMNKAWLLLVRPLLLLS
jgi:hypothetical protein